MAAGHREAVLGRRRGRVGNGEAETAVEATQQNGHTSSPERRAEGLHLPVSPAVFGSTGLGPSYSHFSSAVSKGNILG